MSRWMTKASGDLRLHLQAVEERRLVAVRAEIAGVLAPESRGLAAYRRHYEQALRGPGVPVTLRVITDHAVRSKVTLIGDYHTLAEAQRAATQLAAAVGRQRRVALGLEMVRAEYQGALDRYVGGELSDAEFLSAAQLAEHWPFSWSHYRPILALARRHGWRALALDGPGTLAQRDNRVARRLAASLKRRPDEVHVVLIGDHHLAPDHLPRALLKLTGPLPMVVVHQNEPELYERLVARGIESSVPAVRLGPGRFCVFNATPLRREQSYLAWIESRWAEVPVAVGDPTSELAGAQERLAEALGLDPLASPPAVVETLEFLRELGGQPPERIAWLRRQLVERGYALVPELELAYLYRPDFDVLAELAMLAFVYAADGRSPTLSAGKALDGADWLRQTRHEALAYLGSLLLHPLRQPAGARGAPRWAIFLRQLFQRGVALPRVEAPAVTPAPAAACKAARTIGQELGAQLFDRLATNRLAVADLHAFLAAGAGGDECRLAAHLARLAGVERWSSDRARPAERATAQSQQRPGWPTKRPQLAAGHHRARGLARRAVRSSKES